MKNLFFNLQLNNLRRVNVKLKIKQARFYVDYLDLYVTKMYCIASNIENFSFLAN